MVFELIWGKTKNKKGDLLINEYNFGGFDNKNKCLYLVILKKFKISKIKGMLRNKKAHWVNDSELELCETCRCHRNSISLSHCLNQDYF